MNYRVECKERSKEFLRGRWGNAVGATMVFAISNVILSFFFSAIPIVGWILMFFLTAFLTGSFIKYCIKLTESKERVKYLECFISFKTAFKIAICNLLTGVLFSLLIGIILIMLSALSLAIGSLVLLLVSCVILAFLTFFIEALIFPIPMIFTEDEGVGIIEAIDISFKITKGHRIAYIIMNISFLGWIALSVIFFGIGMLWVQPYMTLAIYLFYKAIRSENNFI